MTLQEYSELCLVHLRYQTARRKIEAGVFTHKRHRSQRNFMAEKSRSFVNDTSIEKLSQGTRLFRVRLVNPVSILSVLLFFQFSLWHPLSARSIFAPLCSTALLNCPRGRPLENSCLFRLRRFFIYDGRRRRVSKGRQNAPFNPRVPCSGVIFL